MHLILVWSNRNYRIPRPFYENAFAAVATVVMMRPSEGMQLGRLQHCGCELFIWFWAGGRSWSRTSPSFFRQLILR